MILQVYDDGIFTNMPFVPWMLLAMGMIPWVCQVSLYLSDVCQRKATKLCLIASVRSTKKPARKFRRPSPGKFEKYPAIKKKHTSSIIPHLPSLKLRVRTWKWMVGESLFSRAILVSGSVYQLVFSGTKHICTETSTQATLAQLAHRRRSAHRTWQTCFSTAACEKLGKNHTQIW